MIAAINDMPFQERFSCKEEAINKIRQWMEVCKKIESEESTAIERLYAIPIDSSAEIAPGYRLIQLVNDFLPKDEKRYLIHLLTNLNKPDTLPKEPFVFGIRTSYICAWAKDQMIISLESNLSYSDSKLKGIQNSKSVELKNIVNEDHIKSYKHLLGIRIYEPNKKHRKEAYVDAAGRYVDAMDLNEEEAQKLLNKAIEINGNLYGKRHGQYYCFQKHHDNYYHGYQNNELGLHITKKIDLNRWD